MILKKGGINKEILLFEKIFLKVWFYKVGFRLKENKIYGRV